MESTRKEELTKVFSEIKDRGVKLLLEVMILIIICGFVSFIALLALTGLLNVVVSHFGLPELNIFVVGAGVLATWLIKWIIN